MESDSVAGLAALLDALVFPENAVCDSVKHSMSLPSNLPDIDARKDELRKLLLRLRPSEVRFLKDELSGITFVTDGIPKLPENVLAKIALDVDIVDVIRFRRVSKAWKRAWDSSSVYKDVMKKYMYGYYESSYKSLPNNSLALRTYFEEKAKRIHCIRHGRFQSLFTLPFGTGDRVGDGPSFPHYHSGKMARMVNSRSTILVMNLHKGSIKWYNTPQRVGLLDFELSSMYLVGRSAQNMLYAWSLNDDRIMEVRLPVRPNSFYVYEDRVGVLLGNQEILIWTIGGKLRHLKYALPGVEQGFHSFRHNAILFNPFDRAEITVISTYFKQLSPNHYCPNVMARSYSSTSPAGRDWSETSTQSRLLFTHKDEANHFVWNHTPPPFNLVVRPITDTGDFNMCPLLPQIAHLKGGDVLQIRYNICEKRLSDAVYLCPPFDYGNPREQAVWNGMLYIHRLDRSDQWAQSGNEIVMGIKPLNEKVGNTAMPFTSTDALWVDDIDEENEETHRIQFKWTRRYEDMTYLDDSNRPSLFADNDFVVLFSKEEALIACYDGKDDLTSLGGVHVTNNSK